MNQSKFYITSAGVIYSVKELVRIEWAKANELQKRPGWKRMFSNNLDLLSFAEGFNAGMSHLIRIQKGEIKLIRNKVKR